MLRRDGRVVLIDFGIATMGEGSPAIEGSFVGSFGYAAPEQLHDGMLRLVPQPMPLQWALRFCSSSPV